MINSRRRIGRNNEHLSESFIACKSLFPAFSRLIFTAGLGGRYYHYLHFIGEERKALTPPSLGGQAVHLGVGVSGAVMRAVRTNFSPDCTGSQGELRLRLLLVITIQKRPAGAMALPKRPLPGTVRAQWPFPPPGPHQPLSCPFLCQPLSLCIVKIGQPLANNTTLGSGQAGLWWESLIKLKPGTVAHARNPSNPKAERQEDCCKLGARVGMLVARLGQPRLHSKTLSQQNGTKQTRKKLLKKPKCGVLSPDTVCVEGAQSLPHSSGSSVANLTL